MANIPEKLGIGNEIREFKLGRSFAGNSATAFHSVRYDFKPASVDTSKMATLAIGERHQVTVTVPHVEGNAQAVFMGSKKQYQKECVFIIDHNTGEITLEKLSSNIQLKKTRSEGSSRSVQNRPITPIDVHPHQSSSHSKKPSPSHSRYSPSSSQLQKGGLSSPNQNRSNPWASTSPQTSPNNPVINPSMPNLLAPSPNPTPPVNNVASSRQVSAPSRPSSRVSPSMPQFLSATETTEVPEAPEIGILSGSSSDSSSSSSSSENSGEESKIKRKKKKKDSSGSSSGANSDSDDPDEHLRTDHRKKPVAAPSNVNHQSVGNSSMLPSMPSMPKLSQLSEDLQLSESESDSDD